MPHYCGPRTFLCVVILQHCRTCRRLAVRRFPFSDAPIQQSHGKRVGLRKNPVSEVVRTGWNQSLLAREDTSYNPLRKMIDRYMDGGDADQAQQEPLLDRLCALGVPFSGGGGAFARVAPVRDNDL